jgi:hypothetical protein
MSHQRVAKRLLGHCLLAWNRYAAKFEAEHTGVTAPQIARCVKWYVPLAELPSRAYFDYCDSLDVAQLWDGMTVHERAEWLVTQLRQCSDRPESIAGTLFHIFTTQKPSTYAAVVAVLAKDVEQPNANEFAMKNATCASHLV